MSLRLPQHKRDHLRRLAESEHRTLSQELRRIIDHHLDGLPADLEQAA